MRPARHRAWLLAAMALLAASSSLAAPPLEAKLQALLKEFRDEYGFPGATVAVALGDGEVVAVAAGLADVEAGTAMTPDSRMLAASIGKSFVAATVLALAADGRLGLDDPVSRHLGARAWFPRLPNHETMTIRHLLRHGSGLVDHVHREAFGRAMALRAAGGGDALDPEAAIAFVLDAAPLFPAGAGWSYSDTGYLLLGLVIEAVAGRSYYAEVAERFLRPLRLADTSPSNRRDLPGLAVGYTAPENPFGIPARTMDREGRLRWDPAVEWTGGGLVSTSRDLALWGQALFTGTAMDRPYLDTLLDGVPVAADAENRRYGAGVAMWTDPSRGPVYGHAGWIPGYLSSLRHYADHGLTIAFQVNSDVAIADDSSDFAPRLERALADFVLAYDSQ